VTTDGPIEHAADAAAPTDRSGGGRCAGASDVNALPGLSNVRFVAAAPELVATGLVGFVAFRVGPLVIASVSVRRTRAGRVTLSFPRRVDRHGIVHYDCRPVDNAAREAIQTEVLAALGIKSTESAP